MASSAIPPQSTTAKTRVPGGGASASGAASSTVPTISVPGVKGSGGSMGGGGPVVYNGMVYVNSGYGLYFHLPGNVLLAYSVDGK